MKVSAGCKNCYAETLDNRWNGGHWGPGSSRRMMSEKHWQQPIKWNADAEKNGRKAMVFCASMADVFEGHPDTLPHLARLFEMIEKTPFLIWQLLTKRPEKILKLVPDWWLNVGFPSNVWIGTSVENQEAADQRIPHLLNVPAKVRFLSMEPLLGPVYVSGWLYPKDYVGMEVSNYEETQHSVLKQELNWIIVGGESGHGARPMHPNWVRTIRDQCKFDEIPFFFKQWGEWGYGFDCVEQTRHIESGLQFFPELNRTFQKVGKKAAGRLLDEKEYNEFPK